MPNYVIKSPRECKSIVVKPEDLKYRVLMIHKDKKELEGHQCSQIHPGRRTQRLPHKTHLRFKGEVV